MAATGQMVSQAAAYVQACGLTTAALPLQRSSTPAGQARTQCPQPVQAAQSIKGSQFGPSMPGILPMPDLRTTCITAFANYGNIIDAWSQAVLDLDQDHENQVHEVWARFDA